MKFPKLNYFGRLLVSGFVISINIENVSAIENSSRLHLPKIENFFLTYAVNNDWVPGKIVASSNMEVN